MNVHLIDGTFELFRHHFAVPSAKDGQGNERGALIGVLNSMLGMFEDGVTHMAVATDHVIESFRNDLWIHYKTGEGMDPELWQQFHPFEDALEAMGVVVWRLIEFEADDGLASGVVLAAADRRVDTVFVCSPDKDLAQCVQGDRIVQFDRMRRTVRNEQGVVEKFGVPPDSIPDYLALVGDAADGFPGIPGWGAKSSATVLAHYGSIDRIPENEGDWDVAVRGAARLAKNLRDAKEAALLFRRLAVLRTDVPVSESVDDLKWRGPTPAFEETAAALGAPSLWRRAQRAGEQR